MEALTNILSQLPAYATALFAAVGIVIALLVALQVFLGSVAAAMVGVGTLIPNEVGFAIVRAADYPSAWAAWCGQASTDVGALANWLRGVLPKTPPTALMLLAAAGLSLSLTACTGSFEVSRLAGQTERASLASVGTPLPADPKRCQSLDDEHRMWNSLAKAGAAVTGASGLAAIPDSDPGIRIGLAVGAVVVGAFTALAVAEDDGASQAWARECQ